MTEQLVNITADEPTTTRRRWFVGAPRWVFCGAAVANALLTLVAYSAPGTYFKAAVISYAIWLALGLAFLMRLALSAALGEGRTSLRRHWSRWIAVPAVFAVTAGLMVSGAPVRVGLQAAKPAMVAFAEAPNAEAPERVGPFGVERADHLPGGGARFLLTGTGFLDQTGFAYSPYGPPVGLGDGEDRYEHISGPWYGWTQSW